MTTRRPLLLSLGDPAGIGPEIAVKAWRALRHTGPVFAVVGDSDCLSCEDATVGVAALSALSQADRLFCNQLPVLHRPLAVIPRHGHPDCANAASVIDWIETAARLTLAGEACAMVTNPIAKASLYEAGFKFAGHTEFLGELAPAPGDATAKGPVMMLAAGNLRVALVTIHEPLAKVAALVTLDRIVSVGRVTTEALVRDFGITAPRIAVTGLNPHAGESGALGREEIEIIAPAVAALRALGIDASGPHPSDSLFHEEARRRFDAVVCMYHDQALIPLKMLDFWGGVNITLGLPIVRTSPDHGVGFDIAGKGIARADSLIAAIKLAAEIAAHRAMT